MQHEPMTVEYIRIHPYAFALESYGLVLGSVWHEGLGRRWQASCEVCDWATNGHPFRARSGALLLEHFRGNHDAA